MTVLGGMQLADAGIHKMKGNEHSEALNSPITQTKYDSSVLENDRISHNIQMKQQKLEYMNAFNLFSFLGKKLSEGISKASKNMIKSITN